MLLNIFRSRITKQKRTRPPHQFGLLLFCSTFRMTSVGTQYVVGTDEGDHDTVIEIRSAPDGGWGWMCVFGCALMHFLVIGYNRSYGLVYMRLRDRFDSSAALTAWIGGFSIAMRMGCSERTYALIWFIIIIIAIFNKIATQK